MATKETEHLPDVRNKMTAVEWMEKELDFLYHHMSQDDIKWFFDKAKQMEKEQAMDLMSNACMFLSASFHDEDFKSMTYEDVYNKYYNA